MATDKEWIQKLEVDMLEVKESIQKLTQTIDSIQHILKELSAHFAKFLCEFSTHFAKCHYEPSCHLEKETKELSSSSLQNMG
jgi:hypothetical protein